MGAPHIGTYIREVSLLGPHSYIQDVPDIIDFSDATDREDLQSLFLLLPNITVVKASSPFLFTNSVLCHCPQLCEFSIQSTLQEGAVVSPTSIFHIFEGTTMTRLFLFSLYMLSTMDSPLKPDSAVCTIEVLVLNVAQNFNVWLPYLQSVMPK